MKDLCVPTENPSSYLASYAHVARRYWKNNIETIFKEKKFSIYNFIPINVFTDYPEQIFQ